MKLITKRLPGVAVIAILVSVAAEAQQATIEPVQPSPRVMNARLSAGPLETGVTNGPATDSVLAVSSGAMLPPTPQPLLQSTTIQPKNVPTQRELRVWKTLLIAQHSAAGFDAWTTRRSIESGNGFERNILVRPFANSAAIYPALQVVPFGFDYLSHRMMRSQNRLFRNTWWMPQAASIAASLWCGSRNLRVASLER